MSAAVEAEELAQRFGARTVFEDVSFTVGQGEVFAILGVSGCGKSTLLRILIGLQPPSGGRARVLGHEVASEIAAIRPKIGVLFQSAALFGSLTLQENVMLPLQTLTELPRDACATIARIKLGQVGLSDAAGLRPAEISGGMAKRAGIARALALDPALLFLDEPSAGLDPVTSAGIDALILRLRDTLGTTFVVVTHEVPSVMAIAGRCLMLDRERRGAIALGEPRRLAQDSDDPAVRAFFRRQAA
jgi:phospholipid/cholesterol/gamma-HCH transport system ATP-binding protein